MTESIVVGVDVGGTLVRAGALSRDGRRLAVEETQIEARLGPEAGLSRIQSLIEAVWRRSGKSIVLGIGIGATGPVDPIRGTINNPYTLPTWENVPVVAPLQQHFGVPVCLENDADVAALGEYWLGAGRNARRLYAITVGTGIGTSFIIEGQIYRGLNGAHPDGGHHVIDPAGPACYCGANGCWESLASGPAIGRQAQAQVANNPASRLLAMANGDASRIDARMVAEAAQTGDAFACSIIEKAAHYFALGVINVVTLFVPDLIVLSGGVMNSADLFMPAIHRAIQRHNVMVPASSVRIAPAQLGAYAGLSGAAYAIAQKLTV